MSDVNYKLQKLKRKSTLDGEMKKRCWMKLDLNWVLKMDNTYI